MTPASTPTSSPRRSASPRRPSASSPMPGSTTCRSPSRTTSPAPADHIAGYKGAYARKQRSPPKSRGSAFPLTVNAVMHRANIDHVDEMVALALKLGAKRVEIAHVQYYGWALKNRAQLMPTREQVDARREGGRDAARAPSRADRDRRGRAGLLRALPEGLRRRLGAALAQCHAVRQGAALPRGRKHSGADVLERARACARRHLGQFAGVSWRFAAPTGCRSRAAHARSAKQDFGGCRCQAFALTGDARATDPVCHLSPHHALVGELAEVRDDAAYDYRR